MANTKQTKWYSCRFFVSYCSLGHFILFCLLDLLFVYFCFWFWELYVISLFLSLLSVCVCMCLLNFLFFVCFKERQKERAWCWVMKEDGWFSMSWGKENTLSEYIVWKIFLFQSSKKYRLCDFQEIDDFIWVMIYGQENITRICVLNNLIS